MTEVEFQVIKSVGFVTALLLAVGLQRLRPLESFAGDSA
jgi:hypothetical protein